MYLIEKAPKRAKQCPSVSLCLAHLSDAMLLQQPASASRLGKMSMILLAPVAGPMPKLIENSSLSP